jgi:hypothetical protein
MYCLYDTRFLYSILSHEESLHCCQLSSVIHTATQSHLSSKYQTNFVVYVCTVHIAAERRAAGCRREWNPGVRVEPWAAGVEPWVARVEPWAASSSPSTADRGSSHPTNMTRHDNKDMEKCRYEPMNSDNDNKRRPNLLRFLVFARL